jgi:hypothetical protein
VSLFKTLTLFVTPYSNTCEFECTSFGNILTGMRGLPFFNVHCRK